jgi:hypothetical protein
LGIVLDTSGTAFTNNLGAEYAPNAIGINPTDQNTTCLTLRNGTTQATNTTMLIPNVGSSSFTIYLKHASRFYTDSIFGHGYALTSSAASINTGNQFTVTFYSLYPAINLPYTITGVLSSDLNGAALTGTFTSNYQQIVFITSGSMASTKTFSMLAGTVTLNVTVVVPLPIATNVDVSKPTGSALFTGFGSNATTNNKTIAGTNYYSGSYIASSSSVATYSTFGAGFLFENTISNSTYCWCSLVRYTRSTTIYTGSNSTTYNGSTTILGEWVQIQLPYKLKLTSFSFVPRNYYANSLPSSFVVLGSLNGTTWSSVYVTSVSTYTYPVEGLYNNVATSFTPNQGNNTAYSSFRVVVNKIFLADQYNEAVVLNKWNLIGDVYT